MLATELSKIINYLLFILLQGVVLRKFIAMINACNKLLLIIFLFLGFATSCVERGKPVEKKTDKTTLKEGSKKIEHYICKNGHKGSDQQGICPECNVAYTHNQAFHGLSIPTNTLKDPFQSAPNSNQTTAPAQNAYGVYHYVCPNGHPGGAGTAANCTGCNAKLVHNQGYHK